MTNPGQSSAATFREIIAQSSGLGTVYEQLGLIEQAFEQGHPAAMAAQAAGADAEDQALITKLFSYAEDAPFRFPQATLFYQSLQREDQGSAEAKATAPVTTPRLTFNPDTLAVRLTAPATDQETTWTIKRDKKTFLRVQRAGAPLNVLIQKPFGTLTLTNESRGETHAENGGERASFEWDFAASKERGLYLVERTTEFTNPQDYLSTSTVYALTNKPNPESYQLGSVEGWQGWYAQLSHASEHPLLFNPQVPQWQEGEVYPYLRSAEGTPVYRTTPSIALPANNAEWDLLVTVRAKDGELLEVEGTGAPETPGTLAPIFEDAEDPWVGRFTITVYKDGQVYESRTFHIAEELTPHLSFPDGAARFTTPHAPQFEMTFSSENEYLTVPEGALTSSLDLTEVSSSFDPETFYLEFGVNPPRLTYILPLLGEPYEWQSHFHTVDIDLLDPDGEFKVRFPRLVGRANLQAGGNSIPLNRTGESGVWTCSVSRLLASLPEDQDVTTLNIQWASQSDHEFIATHDKRTQRTLTRELTQTGTISRSDLEETQLAALSRYPLLESCSVEDGQLTLTLNREPEYGLACRMWTVRNPLAGAITIDIEGTTGTIPAQLADAGPFIIQVKDTESPESWAPHTPGTQSRVAEQLGRELIGDATVRYPWMYIGAELQELTPHEFRQLWNARFALRGALAFAGNREVGLLKAFDRKTAAYLSENPQQALDELSRSRVPSGQQLEEFIRSGLVFKSFAGVNPFGEHAVPWIGLIQELNSARADDARTNAHAINYLRTKGNPLLPAWIQGNPQFIDFALKLQDGLDEAKEWNRAQVDELKQLEVPQLISAEERKAAFAQLADNRSRVLKLKRIAPMIRTLEDKTHRLHDLRIETIIRALSDLEFVAKQSTTAHRDLWLWIPYASAALAFLARMQAHGVTSKSNKLADYRHTWAQIARFAPRLIAYDLVCAEAVVLGQEHLHGTAPEKK